MRLSSREPISEFVNSTIPILGDLTELEILMSISPARLHILLISDPEIRHHQILRIIDFARAHNLEVWVRPQLASAFYGDLKFSNFYGHPIIKIVRTLSPVKVAIKTAFDYSLAAAGTLALLPIMGVVALAIRLSSKGPIFFRQTRVGHRCRNFKVIKFRSMVSDAEVASGPMLSSASDQRVTPLGRFLRKTHLDEIPQLFNVLNGTMSLVGPRPERPFFVERFNQQIPFYVERLSVKPGITGMAQVYGSYHSRADDKLIFDLNYIHNFSLFLDVKIIFLTLWNAFLSMFKRAQD